MLLCTLRKSPPPTRPGAARRQAPLATEGLSTKSLKVAKEPHGCFLEYIYFHLLWDIKIGLSRRQMTESFKDSYCLSLPWSALCVKCCLYTKWKKIEMTLHGGCRREDGSCSPGTATLFHNARADSHGGPPWRTPASTHLPRA